MSLFAVVDVETTGGSLQGGSRITEVAIVVHNGTSIVDTYSSLVNPGIPIPVFISNLTGITDEMVASAPSFHEIADKLYSLFQDKIFVAHNVAFDFSHIKSEFSRCGIKYEAEKMCTCKLGRKVLPGFGSYSLKALSRNLGISLKNHHRALSDATAASAILERLVAEVGIETIRNYSIPEEKEVDIPYHLIENLPEKYGVYFFHDKNGNLLYVGKANNIRKRVVSHFKKGNSFKTKKIKALLHEISCLETGSELLAYLLEMQEIKKHRPFFNYAGKNESTYGLFHSVDKKGIVTIKVDTIENNDALALQSFKSKKSADQFLAESTNRYNLCLCANGIEKSKNSCLYVQTKACNGVYHGIENVTDYNSRAEQFLNQFEDYLKPLILLDAGKNEEEYSVVAYRNGMIGYAYLNKEEALSQEEILDRLTFLPAGVEYKRNFKSFFARNKYKKAQFLDESQNTYST